MIKLAFVCLMIVLLSPPAIAAENYFVASGEKFGNGIVNAATGFAELPKTIILTSQQENPLYGITLGTAQGLLHTVGRSLIGIVDAATFIIPNKTKITPSYVWQDFSTETTY